MNDPLADLTGLGTIGTGDFASPELPSDSMFAFSDNFDWVGKAPNFMLKLLTPMKNAFDNEFLPSHSMNMDWSTLTPEDLLMGP